MTAPSRLQAVQALYQMDMTSLDSEALIREFVEHPLGEETELEKGEQERFEQILRGVAEHLDSIDAKLEAALAQGWRAERMDRTLRAILRASIYEMLFCPLQPANTLIKDYREIAASFFSSGQAGLVRGVLERIRQESDRDE